MSLFKKNLFVSIVCLCLGLLAGCQKSNAPEAQEKAVSKSAQEQKPVPMSDRESQPGEYQELKDKYAKLERDFNNLSVDRDNLINQAKSLLEHRSRALELERLLAEAKKELADFDKNTQELADKNLAYEDKYRDLENEIGRLRNEKKRAEDLLGRERDKGRLKSMEDKESKLLLEIKDLRLEIKDLKSSLGKARSEERRNRALSVKLQSAINARDKSIETKDEELNKQRDTVEKLNKSYAEALKKNKRFEQRALSNPAQLAELARQNRTLIKQTANMHYNLGVFYTKNKEYTRAIAELEKAVELRPDDDYAHFNLGYIYAEYLVNRPKAVEHFRHFLRLTKSSDKDADWAKKYILTWQSWAGKEPMQ